MSKEASFYDKEDQRKGRRRSFLLILALAFIVVLLRVIALESYPVTHPDEGFWYLGAKNFVLYDDALLDGRLHPFLAPVQFVAAVGWFFIIPPSLFSARLLSTLFGLITIIFAHGIGKRLSIKKPLLLVLFVAFNSQLVLSNRIALLESLQICLLTSAAWALFRKHAPIISGILCGLTVLVKVNALYVLPAFFIFFWLSELHRLKKPLQFCCALGGTILIGFTLSAAIDPEAFVAAFRYELDGKHFIDGSALFNFGRFGLHPQRLTRAIIEFVKGTPFLMGLAALALIKKDTWAIPRRLIFAVWLVLGFTFHSAQIFVVPRYYLTFFPALVICAYFGAECLHRNLLIFVLVIFTSYHSLRLTRGISRSSAPSSYEMLTEAISKNSRRGDLLLGSSYIALNAPIKSLGFYRLLFRYPDDSRITNLKGIIKQRGVSILVVDPDMKSYLSSSEIDEVIKDSSFIFKSKDFQAYRLTDLEDLELLQ